MSLATLAALRKSAGKRRSAQIAMMRRLGRADFRLIYELVAKGGGFCGNFEILFSTVGEALPRGAHRLILRAYQKNPPNPVRIFADVAGEGYLARLTFFTIPGRTAPIPSTGRAQGRLHTPAATFEIYFLDESRP